MGIWAVFWTFQRRQSSLALISLRTVVLPSAFRPFFFFFFLTDPQLDSLLWISAPSSGIQDAGSGAFRGQAALAVDLPGPASRPSRTHLAPAASKRSAHWSGWKKRAVNCGAKSA